ncbi:Vacuolar iron transporter 1 (AtVIT1) [Durusdinium trenchii]|uniref:Vacuolar iron transporter 1 (AtVIT1) n=1 Tax=Durusdinium trenchii TaxID=1381693 RepID=A0ABP0MGS4_9DINO
MTQGWTEQHASRDPSTVAAAHEPEAIRARLAEGPVHSYLKDFVYGAIDGAVTTFAVVSGVAGAELGTNIVVILGVANLVGDGFSMAASNYLGTRAERQLTAKVRRMEEEHIDQFPDGEREEIRQILESQGFTGELLERAVNLITKDRERWVEMMLREEHGLSLTVPSAWRAATTTFVAFLVIGLLPLIPFLLQLVPSVNIPAPYVLSTFMTGLAFFAVGAGKSRFVEQSWYWSGFETLAVGGGAAGLAFVCGAILKSVA